MKSDTKMITQAPDKRDQSGYANKAKLILLLLRKNFRKNYMGTLVDRLLESEVTVAVDETNYPQEKQKIFQWILSFPGDIPRGKAPNSDSVGLIFRVLGSPKLQLDNLPSSNSEKLTKLIEHYKEVQQKCKDREKNPIFVKLAVTDAVLRREQQMLKKFADLVSRLEEKMDQVEKTYYQGIGYILSTAIEKITGVAVLDSLMKGLIRVMIIDDLDQRSIDGLVDINFSRKFLSFMSTPELSKKIDDFRSEHAEDEFAKATIGDFIFNSPDFEKVDIVFFNSWKFTEDTFPIRVALRKKTIISKQEERKVERQEQVEGEIVSQEETLEALKEKLKEVVRDIQKMEKSHFDDEDEYQVLNNRSKRLLKDIKISELKIKKLKRPVKAGAEEKIISFDMFEIFKSKQSILDRIGDKASSIGLGKLWGKHMDTDVRFSFIKLSEMARYSKDWIKSSNQLKKISSQAAHLAGQLDLLVEENKLTFPASSPDTESKVNYQPLLDEHILDCLELAVLSCEILNLSGNKGE